MVLDAHFVKDENNQRIVIQTAEFRCHNCNKLLLKGVNGLRHVARDKKFDFVIVCSKCKVRNFFKVIQ